MLIMTKQDHFPAVIEDYANNPRASFATLDHLLHRKKDTRNHDHDHHDGYGGDNDYYRGMEGGGGGGGGDKR